MLNDQQAERVRQEALQMIQQSSNRELFTIGLLLRIIDNSDPRGDDPEIIEFTSDK